MCPKTRIAPLAVSINPIFIEIAKNISMALSRLLLLIFALLTAPCAWAGTTKEGTAPTPSGLEVPRFVSLRYAKVNARVGPSLEHPIKWVYHRKGLPVQITAETEEWRRIKDPDGGVVWVRREMLSGTRTVLIVGREAVPLRKQMDSASAARARLDPGVVATLKSCVAGWCEVKAQGRVGWVESRFLWGLNPREREAGVAPK